MESINQKTLDQQVIKKQKIMSRLKESSFSSMKGSSTLMEKLNKQRLAKQQMKDSEEVNTIIQKQQSIVMQLNDENIKLIEENTRLKHMADYREEQMNQLVTENLDIIEQNSSLKKQLSIAQKNSSRRLKDLSKFIKST